MFMKKITAITLTALTALSSVCLFPQTARANFGDFLLGVGAGAGASILINNSRRDAENRYRPVSPQQEFSRGLQDGINGARYDNPRNSYDYDKGFQEGIRRRASSR